MHVPEKGKSSQVLRGLNSGSTPSKRGNICVVRCKPVPACQVLSSPNRLSPHHTFLFHTVSIALLFATFLWFLCDFCASLSSPGNGGPAARRASAGPWRGERVVCLAPPETRRVHQPASLSFTTVPCLLLSPSSLRRIVHIVCRRVFHASPAFCPFSAPAFSNPLTRPPAPSRCPRKQSPRSALVFLVFSWSHSYCLSLSSITYFSVCLSPTTFITLSFFSL